MTDLLAGSPAPVDIRQLETALETLLFVADGPVEVGRLQRALQVDRRDVDDLLARLAAAYRERGVRVQRSGECVQLVSAPESAACVERFLGLADGARLSAAALETLAIVAYQQPVTRVRIEAIRGVSSDYALRMLLARNLIEEQGRLETVGRPAVFGTTFEFLRYFGLASLAELPALSEQLAQLAAEREDSASAERAAAG